MTTAAFRGLTETVRFGGAVDGAVTVNTVLPDTRPTVAVMVLVPAAIALTVCGSPVAPKVATDVAELTHVACAVTSFCELSV